MQSVTRSYIIDIQTVNLGSLDQYLSEVHTSPFDVTSIWKKPVAGSIVETTENINLRDTGSRWRMANLAEKTNQLAEPHEDVL